MAISEIRVQIEISDLGVFYLRCIKIVLKVMTLLKLDVEKIAEKAATYVINNHTIVDGKKWPRQTKQ